MLPEAEQLFCSFFIILMNDKWWFRPGYSTHVNPIPTGLGHVTLIQGLIPPLAGRNRLKKVD